VRSFTDEQVIQIRETYAAGGVSHMTLASIWRTEPPVIGNICRGVSYRDVPGPISRPGKRARVVHLLNAHGNPTCGAPHTPTLTVSPDRQEATCARCLR
jgi:hypothetical protein